MGRFENFRIGRACPLLVVVKRLKPLTALIPRLHDEAGSTSWLYESTTCTLPAHDERSSCARRASS